MKFNEPTHVVLQLTFVFGATGTNYFCKILMLAVLLASDQLEILLSHGITAVSLAVIHASLRESSLDQPLAPL